jgi:hypothetical protein
VNTKTCQQFVVLETYDTCFITAIAVFYSDVDRCLDKNGTHRVDDLSFHLKTETGPISERSYFLSVGRKYACDSARCCEVLC